MRERASIAITYQPSSRGFCTHNKIVEDRLTGNLYVFYHDYGANKIMYKKSLDAGYTWGSEVEFTSGAAGSIHCISIWYDGWTLSSNDGKIDVAWSEAGIVYHKQLTTSNDSLSSRNTIHNTGYNSVGSSAISITRSRGGNLYCLYTTNGSSLGEGFRKSVDNGANWSSLTTGGEGTTDIWLMLPDYQADSNDVMAIYWDSSATEVSVKRYDDSANTWAETSISTGVSNLIASNGITLLNAVTDYENNQNYVVFSTNPISTQSVKVYAITSSSVVSKTNLATSVGGYYHFMVSLSLVGGVLYATYFGGLINTTDQLGKEKLGYKTSTNGGTNWSNDNYPSITEVSFPTALFVCPRSYSNKLHVIGVITSLMSNLNSIDVFREIRTPIQSFNM